MVIGGELVWKCRIGDSRAFQATKIAFSCRKMDREAERSI
jgi:hypothetical protein